LDKTFQQGFDFKLELQFGFWGDAIINFVNFVFFFLSFVVKTFVTQIIQILPQGTQRGHKETRTKLCALRVFLSAICG